jgi:hypothetical protein
MEDELGLNIMQTLSSLCWAHESIVTDLYRFRLHVYNCMTVKYHCLLQNPFLFRYPLLLSRRFFFLSRGL